MVYYIYLILNRVNGKTYIGQRRSNLEWNEDKYMGSGVALKSAKEKYGIENFEKFLIQHCYSKEELNKAEKFYKIAKIFDTKYIRMFSFYNKTNIPQDDFEKEVLELMLYDYTTEIGLDYATNYHNGKCQFFHNDHSIF